MCCDFPALTLVREMRRVAKEAGDGTASHALMLYSCAYVRATNQLRLAHEDMTQCECWYEALDAAGTDVFIGEDQLAINGEFLRFEER
jgi:hypothetical protein